jgi:hypothetical protein
MANTADDRSLVAALIPSSGDDQIRCAMSLHLATDAPRSTYFRHWIANAKDRVCIAPFRSHVVAITAIGCPQIGVVVHRNLLR